MTKRNIKCGKCGHIGPYDGNYPECGNSIKLYFDEPIDQPINETIKPMAGETRYRKNCQRQCITFKGEITLKQQKPASVFARKTGDYSKPTRWLTFHTYCRLPVGGVTSAILSSLYFATTLQENAQAKGFYAVFAIFQLFFCVLSWIAFVGTKKLNNRGYWTNMTIFIANIVWSLALLTMSNIEEYKSYALALLPSSFVGVVFAICNIVYFRKRKDLFGFDETCE